MKSKVLSIEETVVIEGIYKHYKGGFYEVIGLVKDATPEEPRTMVLYESLKDEQEWVREIHNFTGYVFRDEEWKKRFEFVRHPY